MSDVAEGFEGLRACLSEAEDAKQKFLVKLAKAREDIQRVAATMPDKSWDSVAALIGFQVDFYSIWSAIYVIESSDDIKMQADWDVAKKQVGVIEKK